jgi:hypothetical protein
MSPRRALPLAIVLVLVAVLGTGCYTVLRHPEVDPYASPAPSAYSSGYDRWDRDYYGTDPGFLYRWTDPYYTSLYGDFPPAWGYYYYHPWTPTGPWWYDPWVPWHPWDPDGGSPPPVTGGRHAWDRGPGAPSPTAGSGSGSYVPGVGGSAPSPGGVVPQPAAPATPVTPKPDTTRAPERRPDPTRSEDNPHRNAWGR